MAGEKATIRYEVASVAYLLFISAIGTLAWSVNGAVLLAAMLPWLMHNPPDAAAMPSGIIRRWPTWVALAWFGPGNVTLFVAATRYFGDGVTGYALSIGLPIMLTLLQAAPFALLLRLGAPPVERMIRTAIALAISVLPPLGLVFWRNPLMVAGEIAPGSGVTGLIAFWLLLCASTSGWKAIRHSRALAAVTIMSAGWLIAHDAMLLIQRPSEHRAAADYGWFGIGTGYSGVTPTPGDRGREIAERLDWMLMPGVRGIVLPEGVLSPLSPADEVELSAMSYKARQLGIDVLIGATTAVAHDGTWQNGVYLIGASAPAGRVGEWVDHVRTPMPGTNWQIGSGVPSRVWNGSLVRVGDVTVAMSLCYEDTILWPHRDALWQRTRLMLSMGNRWALSGSYAARVQDMSAVLVARLMGARLVRATNEWDGREGVE